MYTAAETINLRRFRNNFLTNINNTENTTGGCAKTSHNIKFSYTIELQKDYGSDCNTLGAGKIPKIDNVAGADMIASLFSTITTHYTDVDK